MYEWQLQFLFRTFLLAPSSTCSALLGESTDLQVSFSAVCHIPQLGQQLHPVPPPPAPVGGHPSTAAPNARAESSARRPVVPPEPPLNEEGAGAKEQEGLSQRPGSSQSCWLDVSSSCFISKVLLRSIFIKADDVVSPKQPLN